MTKITEDLIKNYTEKNARRVDALAEVLCSAYKDATGLYPSDRVREAIYEAVDK